MLVRSGESGGTEAENPHLLKTEGAASNGGGMTKGPREVDCGAMDGFKQVERVL